MLTLYLYIINCPIFQNVTLPLIDMVVPAPRVRRPFEEMSQPFSSGCSKLCNHPADPDRSQPHLNMQGDQWVRVTETRVVARHHDQCCAGGRGQDAAAAG